MEFAHQDAPETLKIAHGDPCCFTMFAVLYASLVQNFPRQEHIDSEEPHINNNLEEQRQGEARP